MADTVEIAGLTVARTLRDFLENEALPGTGVTPEPLLVVLRRHPAGPRARATRALLAKRDELQAQDRRLAPRAPGASRSTSPPIQAS